MIKKFEINLPINIKILILKYKNNKNNIIYVFNNHKKFIFFLNKNNIKIDKWSNTIIFNNKIKNKFFEEFFKIWNLYILKKIKFKGKGFKIKFFKKNKIIKFFFGKSHITNIFLKKILKKKINKYKFILLSLNKNKISKIIKHIKNIKNINLYTLRGIRESKQIIYKRKGKKGTYI